MIRGKKRTAAALSIATMALALGGCQALGIGSHGMTRALAKAESSAIAEFGAEQLEEGRRALREGRTTDAIDAFMLAKSFEEQAPAAYNGLAVAYSRVGREDLTERFFQVAIALSPDEERYRSNLAAFYMRSGMPRSTGVAFRGEAVAPLVDDAPPVVAQELIELPAEPTVRSLGAGVSVRTSVSRLQRVSSSEVIITHERPMTRFAASTGGHRAVIEVGKRSTSSVAPAARVAMAGPRAVPRLRGSSEYPIRIRLDD